MRRSGFIDCEYYVKSLDLASFTIEGVTASDRIALRSWLQDHDVADLADGQELFDQLFPEGSKLRTLYRTHADRRLRFFLRMDPSVAFLHQIPWESLSENLRPADAALPEPSLRQYARGGRDLFVRLIDSTSDQPVLKAKTLRVLVAIASPDHKCDELGHGVSMDTPSAPPIDTLTLHSKLVDVVNRYPKSYDVTALEYVTLETLRTQLEEGGHHILHLIAHGAPGGGILVHDDGLDPQHESATRLAAAIPATRQLRLVNLMVCHSAETDEASGDSLAMALVNKGIPAVVAMTGTVDERTAATFAEGFYKALHLTGYLDESVNRGRQSVYLQPEDFSFEWSAPVLFMQKGSQKLWRTFQEAARLRRRIQAALPYVAAAVLLLTALGIWDWLKQPIPVVVQRGEIDDVSAGMTEAFIVALEAIDAVEVVASPPEERPYLELVVPARSIAAQPTSMNFQCSPVGLADRPVWWPRKRIWRVCQTGLQFVPLSDGNWIEQIETGVQNSFRGYIPPLENPFSQQPTLDEGMRVALADVALSFLLQDKTGLGGSNKTTSQPAILSSGAPSSRSHSRIHATYNNYYNSFSKNPPQEPLPGGSLSSALYLKAQQFRSQGDDLHGTDAIAAKHAYSRATAIYHFLLANHPSGDVDIPKDILQLQKAYNSGREHSGSPDLTEVEALAAGCQEPNAATNASQNYSHVSRLRGAACYLRALILAETADQGGKFLEDFEASIEDGLRANPPGLSQLDLQRHHLEQLRLRFALRNTAFGQAPNAAQIRDAYACLVQRLGEFQIEVTPSTLGLGGEEVCPQVDVLEPSKLSSARIVDLLDLTSWVGIDIIQGHYTKSGRTPHFEADCAERLYSKIMGDVISVSTRHRGLQNTENSQRIVDTLQSYRFVASAHLGSHYYQRGTMEDLPRAREALVYGYRELLNDVQLGWNPQALNSLENTLATVLIELGYYTSADTLLSRHTLNESMYPHLILKLENMKGNTVRGHQAADRLTNILSTRNNMHVYYRSKMTALIVQRDMQLGEIDKALERIAQAHVETPIKYFSQHLQRLYAQILIDDLRIEEARQALEMLGGMPIHAANSDMEDKRDDLAWARLLHAEGRSEEALTRLESMTAADGPLEVGQLRSSGALFPEALVLAAQISFGLENLQRAQTLYEKARISLDEVRNIDNALAQSLRQLDDSKSNQPSTSDPWFVNVELSLQTLAFEMHLARLDSDREREEIDPRRSEILDRIACWKHRLAHDSVIPTNSLNQTSDNLPQCISTPGAKMNLPIWRDRFALLQAQGSINRDNEIAHSALNSVCRSRMRTSHRLYRQATELSRRLKHQPSFCRLENVDFNNT